MITLEELRKMILADLGDNKPHTRQELIDHAKEKYSMSYYNAERKMMSAISSLIKKGDLLKLDKGIYQMQYESQMAENKLQSEDVGTQFEQKM